MLPDLYTLLPWGLIGLALGMALLGGSARRWLWPAVCGYALAVLAGRLGAVVLLPLGLLLLAGGLLRATGVLARRAGIGVLLLVAAGLVLHRFPGFGNLPLWQAQTLGPGVLPSSAYLNLDKPLLGLALLLRYPPPPPSRAAIRALVLLPATVVLVLALAWLAGVIAWQPVWSPGRGPAWPLVVLWLANNLLIVCVVEELLFRGGLQAWLARRWSGWRHGPMLALLFTAVLFGLAHAPGGVAWVLLATLAGLGYGLAWQRGGLPAAVLVHFAVNAGHFLLFSYPQLA
ncbi:CPBP family intramembrane glutamic endopeptidase [Chitinilyticum piscinae]|uniref:CPBP family intramembrane metalloprotease n=1 Tax=Chitinilyticum piscinae TaxID=2866724 RepID=A0A8J7KB16_9NEIS|nr:CPBP family intramembrane glutamic endopeptidase [Chitinilyticum piscinae]MBE9609724.1 CPBP family intramembrane metalloprotease [Chitinilyticum piscinae]